MVMNEKKHREKTPARQAFQDTHSQPNKIGPSTPFEFNGKNLTAYGGLLPVATMLDRSYDIKTSLIRDKSYVGKKIA